MNTERKFDPAQYPRTYKMSWGWKVLMLGGGGAMGIGSLLGIWFFSAGKEELPTIGAYWMMIAICMSLALLGFYSMIVAIRTKVVLMPDAIEAHGIFKVKRLRRDDIAGYRVRNVQGTNMLELQPRQADAKPVKFYIYFRSDTPFDAWFCDMENFNITELNAALEELQNDPALGFTPEQRIEKVNRARETADALNKFSLLCAGWAIFYPRPYALVMALIAGLPWVALLVRWSHGRAFELDGKDKSLRANLTSIMLLPPLVLVLRASMDVDLVFPTDLIIPSIVGGILATGIMALAAPELRNKAGLISLSIFMMIYHAGALPIGNMLLDRTEGERFRATVLSKRETSGRGASRYFTVPAWGPYKAAGEISAPRWLYDETAVGQEVCVVLRDGGLGFQWFYIRSQSNC